MRKILIVFLALVLVLAACAPDTPEPTPDAPSVGTFIHRTISPKAAKRLFDNGKPLTLVDVRTAEEYAQGHIPGAILIPNEEIHDTRPEKLADLNTTIILYCRSGRRSLEAAEKLAALGYTDVRDLGGINDWPYNKISGDEAGVWAADSSAAPANGIMSSFTAKALSGEVLDESLLTDFKLTMVNVWATFCPPCIEEMPDLGQLSAEYAPKGVQIVGLISDVLKSDGLPDPKQLATAKSIVAKTGANYPHIVPSEEFFGVLGSVPAVPTTFFVDEYGNQVGDAYVGAKSKEDWIEVINLLLAEVEQ